MKTVFQVPGRQSSLPTWRRTRFQGLRGPLPGPILPVQLTLWGGQEAAAERTSGCCVWTKKAAELWHAWNSAESRNLDVNLVFQVRVNMYLLRYCTPRRYNFQC